MNVFVLELNKNGTSFYYCGCLKDNKNAISLDIKSAALYYSYEAAQYIKGLISDEDFNITEHQIG